MTKYLSSILLGLFWFTPVCAIVTGQETTEHLVHKINVNECSWIEVVEKDTTTHYQEYVPFVTPTQPQSYAFSNLEGGGETGEGYIYEFMKNCEEYERQGIETYNTRCPGYGIGNSSGGEATTVGFLPGGLGGYWKQWDDTSTSIHLRHVSLCEEIGTCHHDIPWSPPEGPQIPTPESDSLTYLIAGITLLGISRFMKR